MVRTRITVVGVAFTGLLLAAALVSAQSADPWIGTWRLNLAKSKFSPGPAPTSSTLKVEAVSGGAQKHTFDGANAQGQATHSERVARFDGADVPVQAIAPATKSVNTNAFRRLGDHSFEVLAKADGKLTSTNRIVVSADGKTLTQTTTGTNAQGQAVSNVSVYDKQ
jgi:hypothetical protein